MASSGQTPTRTEKVHRGIFESNREFILTNLRALDRHRTKSTFTSADFRADDEDPPRSATGKALDHLVREGVLRYIHRPRGHHGARYAIADREALVDLAE